MAEKMMTLSAAAEVLGISSSGLRQRVMAGKQYAKKVRSGKSPSGYMWMIPASELLGAPRRTASPNGDKPDLDGLETIADELIGLGRRMKHAIRLHDDKVRRDAITNLGSSLIEGSKR